MRSFMPTQHREQRQCVTVLVRYRAPTVATGSGNNGKDGRRVPGISRSFSRAARPVKSHQPSVAPLSGPERIRWHGPSGCGWCAGGQREGDHRDAAPAADRQDGGCTTAAAVSQPRLTLEPASNPAGVVRFPLRARVTGVLPATCWQSSSLPEVSACVPEQTLRPRSLLRARRPRVAAPPSPTRSAVARGRDTNAVGVSAEGRGNGLNFLAFFLLWPLCRCPTRPRGPQRVPWRRGGGTPADSMTMMTEQPRFLTCAAAALSRGLGKPIRYYARSPVHLGSIVGGPSWN
ncbi:hypothetical protein ACCO45_009758 [Purpureocillium lilacinum]|uniref:Uncharacterized protein n=1 Tax=Purpureocillium lilacinum TaxID=33203 RepID=A0ACC4DM38_PURLI